MPLTFQVMTFTSRDSHARMRAAQLLGGRAVSIPSECYRQERKELTHDDLGRPDLALLLFPAAEAPLRRLGESREATPAAHPWRARSRAELGLGRSRSAA